MSDLSTVVAPAWPLVAADRRRRRQTLSRLWAGAVIGWALVRALIVWAALGDYGVNPWVYLAVDLACSAVDAVTTPRTVISFVDSQYRSAIRWAAVSIVVFLIPDLYLFVGSGHLPAHVALVVGAVVTVTLTVSSASVVRKVRRGRGACRIGIGGDLGPRD